MVGIAVKRLSSESVPSKPVFTDLLTTVTLFYSSTDLLDYIPGAAGGGVDPPVGSSVPPIGGAAGGSCAGGVGGVGGVGSLAPPRGLCPAGGIVGGGGGAVGSDG